MQKYALFKQKIKKRGSEGSRLAAPALIFATDSPLSLISLISALRQAGRSPPTKDGDLRMHK